MPMVLIKETPEKYLTCSEVFHEGGRNVGGIFEDAEESDKHLDDF